MLQNSARVALLYSSFDGQTKKIVSHIFGRISPYIKAELYNLSDFDPLDLERYDAVLLGAALRYGFFSNAVRSFTYQYHNILNSKKTAFMGVCLTARKPLKRTAETNVYVRRFFDKNPWKPDIAVAVAGSLLYPRYTWYDRLAIRLIMTMTGGETDPTKEIEFTDWDQVNDFTDSFLKEIQ